MEMIITVLLHWYQLTAKTSLSLCSLHGKGKRLRGRVCATGHPSVSGFRGRW